MSTSSLPTGRQALLLLEKHARRMAGGNGLNYQKIPIARDFFMLCVLCYVLSDLRSFVFSHSQLRFNLFNSFNNHRNYDQ